MPQPVTAVTTEDQPSIGDSLDSFVGAPDAPDSSSPPPAPEPTTPPAKSEAPKVEPTNPGDIDLSGKVDTDIPAKPETTAKSEEPDFEKFDKELGEAPAKKVRRQYFKTKTELDRLKQELNTLKTQPKPPDSNGTASVETIRQEAEALKKRLADVEKERDSHAQQIAKLDVTSSPEFKAKYFDTWKAANQKAYDQLSQYTRPNDKGEQVPLTWEDIRPIFDLPLKQADEKAAELFGENRTAIERAMRHRDAIEERRTEYSKAVERFEAESQNAIVERSKEADQIKQFFGSEVTRLAKEYPDLYTPAADNPRETEQVTRGSQLAQAALFGIEGMTPQARIQAAAITFQRAANFPVLAIRAAGYKAEIARLTKEVDDLKNGLPGGGLGSGGDSKTEETTGDSLDNFVKNLR